MGHILMRPEVGQFVQTHSVVPEPGVDRRWQSVVHLKVLVHGVTVLHVSKNNLGDNLSDNLGEIICM